MVGELKELESFNLEETIITGLFVFSSIAPTAKYAMELISSLWLHTKTIVCELQEHILTPLCRRTELRDHFF